MINLLTHSPNYPGLSPYPLTLINSDNDIVVKAAKLLAPNHPVINGPTSAVIAHGVSEPARGLDMTLALVDGNLSQVGEVVALLTNVVVVVVAPPDARVVGARDAHARSSVDTAGPAADGAEVADFTGNLVTIRFASAPVADLAGAAEVVSLEMEVSRSVVEEPRQLYRMSASLEDQVSLGLFGLYIFNIV